MPPKENPEMTCEECIHFFACSRQCGEPMAQRSATGCECYETIECSMAYYVGTLDGAKGKIPNRLRELAEADKDGRVVVLPCKDWMDIVFGGQTLFWGIDTDYIENPIREISVDGAERIGWYVGWKTVFLKGTDENGETWEFSPDEIGKTVFLSREEAKRALQEMEGRKDG